MQHKPLRKLPPTHTLKKGIQQSGRFTRNTATDGVGPWQVIPQDAGYISLLPKAAIGRDDVILDLGRQQGWWVNVRCFGEVGNERHRQFLFKSLLCQQGRSAPVYMYQKRTHSLCWRHRRYAVLAAQPRTSCRPGATAPQAIATR